MKEPDGQTKIVLDAIRWLQTDLEDLDKVVKAQLGLGYTVDTLSRLLGSVDALRRHCRKVDPVYKEEEPV